MRQWLGQRRDADVGSETAEMDALERQPEEPLLSHNEEELETETGSPGSSVGSGGSEFECRICGETESSKHNQLITPCECTGSISKIHVECLEKWILNRPGNRAVGDNLECEICHTPYRVSLVHRLRMDLESLCSLTTFAHALEAILLLLCLGCILFILYSGLPIEDQTHPEASDRAAIVALSALIFAVVFLTLRRLFIRWHRTSSIPRVVVRLV